MKASAWPISRPKKVSDKNYESPVLFFKVKSAPRKVSETNYRESCSVFKVKSTSASRQRNHQRVERIACTTTHERKQASKQQNNHHQPGQTLTCEDAKRPGIHETRNNPRKAPKSGIARQSSALTPPAGPRGLTPPPPPPPARASTRPARTVLICEDDNCQIPVARNVPSGRHT